MKTRGLMDGIPARQGGFSTKRRFILPILLKTILAHIEAQAPKPGESPCTRESRTATGQSVLLIHRNVSVYPYVAAKC